MPRYQVPSSFDEKEIAQMDARIEELGLRSRYAYLRYVVLKDLGIEYHGKFSKKDEKPTVRGTNQQTSPTDRGTDEESVINDIDDG